MRLNFLVVVICVCLSQTIDADVRVVRQAPNADGSVCVTPDNIAGSCVNIKSCPWLNQLLETNNGQFAPSASDLRQWHCGSAYAGSETVVCCPHAASTTVVPRWNAASTTTTSSRWNAASTTTTSSRWNEAHTTTATSSRSNGAHTTTAASRWNEAHTTTATSSRSNGAHTTTAASRSNAASTITTSRSNAASSKTTEKPANTNYEECGKSDRKESRIVGGTNATLGDWPWMVALGYRSSSLQTESDFKCGASLISKNWVITAAHCVRNIGTLQLTDVRLGDLDLNPSAKDGATPVDEEVAQIIPHPQYTTNPISNDIALIRLKNSVKFSKHIRPICLLSGDEYRSETFYARKMPYIIGWGALEWRGAMSTRLQETRINIVNTTDCAKTYTAQPSATIDERVLCAGEKNRDTCQGDSGGPLIFPVQGEGTNFIYYLGGIVSFGVKCADLTFPGVYTRVAAFNDWISQTTGLDVK